MTPFRVFALIILFGLQSFAVDANQFCSFLLNRSEVRPEKAMMAGADVSKNMDELLAVMDHANGFLKLAPSAVDRKLTWAQFKTEASQKGVKISDFYQPQYDEMYLLKYCGIVATESKFVSVNGRVLVDTKKTSFSLVPNPAEHEYSKQITGTR
jgi:hypothetical protein